MTPAESLAQVEARSHSTVTTDSTVWRRWGGNASDPAPLVLLHGGAGSWAHWIRNIDALSSDRPLWLPDLPGLGDSPTPPAPRDHTAVAAVLARDVDALLPGPFDLVGFSFGGIVAAFLAALRPGRVRKLILVGAGGLGLRKGQQEILKPWLGLKDPAERGAAHRHNLGSLMLSSPERIDALAMQVYTRDVVRARINSARSSRSDPLKNLLPSLRIPVHGIWGRLDITARARFDEIHTLLRSVHAEAQLKIVEDAGHWVQYEQTAAFNAALIELLAIGH